jgi:hypothetical protein
VNEQHCFHIRPSPDGDAAVLAGLEALKDISLSAHPLVAVRECFGAVKGAAATAFFTALCLRSSQDQISRKEG